MPLSPADQLRTFINGPQGTDREIVTTVTPITVRIAMDTLRSIWNISDTDPDTYFNDHGWYRQIGLLDGDDSELYTYFGWGANLLPVEFIKC
jgi:hypothetical protein